jgi:3-hydroxymyristoyl/3-hydroxydecanoyl-(acyl carrier protein) dehydratase
MTEAAVEVFRNEMGFSAESRFLDGHFPGEPIVPGAISLSFLAACLAGTGRTLARIERMKFSRILRAEVPFELRLTRSGGRVRAEWCDDRGVFATARLVLRPVDG